MCGLRMTFFIKMVESLRDLDISEEGREKIVSGNAKKLLQLA
jgi:predicted TIM-barrel fold metal-dependent hydrolase